MRRSRLCLAALAALAIVPASAAAAAPRTFEVVARKGQEARAIAAVHRYGGRVTLRRGRTLQVRLPPRQALGGAPAAPAFAGRGRSRSAGPTRSSRRASTARAPTSCRPRGCAATGVKIAVLDLGFGTRWRSKLGTELPPASGIDAVQSFDARRARRRSPGSRRPTRRRATASRSPRSCTTWRPNATLTLVNYHTELEFEQAVDWLVHGPDGHPRVDIVVHSNSFLDGPFDGTGETARAVDAAHAAGILWVNSVGNYAPAALGGQGRRPRRRHVRRHDRRGRPEVLDPGQRRHGGDAAVVGVHRRRRSVGGGIGLVRARHHTGRGRRRRAARTGAARRDPSARDRLVDVGRGRHVRAARPPPDGRRGLPVQRLHRRRRSRAARRSPSSVPDSRRRVRRARGRGVRLVDRRSSLPTPHRARPTTDVSSPS